MKIASPRLFGSVILFLVVSNMNFRKTISFYVKRVFWLIGLYWTIMSVWSNVIKYNAKQSTITREDVRILSDQSFPRLVLCSDSMHSRAKLKTLYPMINDSLLETLYGQEQETYWGSNNHAHYDELDKIDMLKFYEDTSPRYYLFKCKLLQIDCRFLWKRIWTVRGLCIELDVERANAQRKKYGEIADMSQRLLATLNTNVDDNDMYQQSVPRHKKTDPMKRIEITVGFNKSDGTFGWNQYRDTLTMYYSHPKEKFIQREHSFPLVPGLTPMISVEFVETTLLGTDF